jgi:DNA polymerase III epsilon subunit-like protein
MKKEKGIIFFDTEFTYLNAKKGQLLSIGLVKESGEELYIELEPPAADAIDPWVIEHVLPFLSGNFISREDARTQLVEFVGPDKPFLLAYVNQFDAVYWYDLFEDPQKHPAFWIPLDFASILFAHGFDPGSMGKQEFFDRIGVNKSDYTTRGHNALEDAKLLKEVYECFISYIGKSEK